MATFIACAWHISRFPFPPCLGKPDVGIEYIWLHSTTLHHMNAKKRCVAIVVVSLVLLVLPLVSALDVHLDGFRLPPSPDKWHRRWLWRRPKEKWFHFLGRISGMFSFHFIFLISLNLLGVCVCVVVCALGW